MTTLADVANIGLQIIGSRTTVTQTEINNNSSNEAKQINICAVRLRDEMLRKAPWNCALNTANLVYITSQSGTPENTSPAPTLWQKGLPPPPWAYEYQYPVDCLRPCWIIPAIQTGFAGGVPITTAVTGGGPVQWTPPIAYKVQSDQFYPVTAATVANGGANYAVGDLITLASGLSTNAPIGAPVVLQVLTLAGSAVATVAVVPQVFGSSPAAGGSYFAKQTNPVAQGSTTGVGAGATFNLTFGAQSDQRVILTNQEFATLAYVKRVTDPNVMDDLFIRAWGSVIAATITMALSGDKALANMAITTARETLSEARGADGNEGLTVNDVTPDFIRTRGVSWTEWYMGPYSQGFDWGPTWAYF